MRGIAMCFLLICIVVDDDVIHPNLLCASMNMQLSGTYSTQSSIGYSSLI